ncbi:hypothetical protein Mycch_2926 [Mycolicibacterium chubuense NBB4]|uniref:PknH-like extracellular domain-containing protein n=1 Tax=Mycolicibacterium chubuense (strain NBB4) TaxID=710421 RepID=I4BK79_MYCCN|nr:sensor domain-containing protein [Mycolicibacterium chubuense]AFM17686.1 hypothetical protein Mycch_2926 [Mycolicibacterium chubuense NBB4]
MRQSMSALAGICLLLAGCGNAMSNAESPAPTRTMIPRPLVERELAGLLLSPEQTAAAVGAPAMMVTEQQTTMSDNSETMAPPECLAIDGAAESVTYANSGYTAERDQSLKDGNDFKHYAKQAVVLFPYLEKATEFFETSVQQWSACHEYTHTQTETHWTVGKITNENKTLATIATQQDSAAPGWGCGRTLAQRNNVIIDVNTCSANPADSAVKIADQIGANVLAKW